MSSFAPCLHEDADTIMFAHATVAAKMDNKKLSSCTVGTDVSVLVIHVVQQLRVDKLCVGKINGHRWYEMKLSCFYFIHSHGAINIFSLWSWKTVGKLSSCN